MWYTSCTREELLGLIEGDGDLEVAVAEFDRLPDLAREFREPVAYWKDDPRGGSTIPTGIVVRSKEIREFIAWVATYVPLRPFSAYCRILDSEAIEYVSHMHEPRLGSIENSCLGVILAECVRDSRGQEPLRGLSSVECEGALSFALARSLALGLGFEQLGVVEAQWHKAGSLVSRRFDSNTDMVMRIFRLAFALEAPSRRDFEDGVLLDAARDIANAGHIRDEIWARLASGYLELQPLADLQKSRREDRIQRLRTAVDSLPQKGDPLLAFVIGYLGSAIAPGTFDHYGTMRQVDSRVPGALLWYGFCAGLYRRAALQGFGGGLARRVLRDLERSDSVYGRPYCDIAVSELEVLMGAEKGFDFNIGFPGTIEIELAPCVTTFYPVRQQSIEAPPDLSALLRELDYRLLELSRVRNRIAHSIGQSEQRQLTFIPRGKRS